MSFETIRNYYEQMVIKQIQQRFRKEKNQEYLADVACVALNHLPPRYYRHEVDMLFYMSPVERTEMEDKIETAIDNAVKFIEQRRRATAP